MKCFCVCFGVMIVMLVVWVEVGIAQSDWMPDASLRAEVLADLKSLNIVEETDTTFTKANIADSRYTVLTLYTSGDTPDITDITGLEYATSATELALDSNKISNISALSGLTTLTVLTLPGNEVSNISALSGLTALTELLLGVNKISNISALSGLTALTELRLNDNKISDISALSGLTALTELHLNDNKISDISALSGLTTLRLLYLDNNKISKLDALVGLTNLTQLWLQGNRVTDINEFKKLSTLTNLDDFLLATGPSISLAVLNNDATLRSYLWVRPSAIDPDRAVLSEDDWGDPPTETFPFTIRFSEPVTGFEMEDIIVETKLHTGTGTATLEALTPTLPPERFAQTYTVTILLPSNAAGTLRLIVRAGAAETDAGRIDPAVDRVLPWIAFSTLPEPSRKRRIIYECPVGWVRSDGFAGRNRRVLLYEVNLEMDMHDLVSIYKPVWVAIYVHPDEALENLDGWKLHVALPYNHHREYPLTAENSVVVDSEIEGVEGGFAFIANPEEAPFPMAGIGFTGSPAPGFDYRLYDETGKRVDFGISCYKRGDIFQVLKEMEDPRVLRQVLLESFDWDADFIRSEWTVPVPVNAPGAPSLVKQSVVGTWADLKKQ